VPRSLVGRETANGVIPAGFSPIFRDRHELAASGDLGHTIREALAGSRCLIVLCSPEAARSRWTNEEIIAFKKAHPTGPVLAAIVAGEPFASDLPGREAEECFPPALRQKFDSRGRPTAKRAEPIAADLRATGDGRQLGLLKIVAGMIGVGLDELVQREQQRRHKRLTYIAAASLAGMAATSGLAVFAFDKRDEARDQRREAEGLVGFMLGDLRDKLEPIGRLDALDAVGSRALQYFEEQDLDDLSDEALAQRSRALTLMAEIANTRGDTDGALIRYREAMSGTAEMVRRAPSDPERLFDHAQILFAFGQIALSRGRLRETERAWRGYRDLAYRMVALDPADPRWQMETQYGDANLGVVLYKQRRYPEASASFSHALRTIERVSAAYPGNRDYQESFSTALAWLADSQLAEGKLDEAISQRERQIEFLSRLAAGARSDVRFKAELIPARQALGWLFAWRGMQGPATDQFQAAVSQSEALIPLEPDNMDWLVHSALVRLALAESLLSWGRLDQGAVHVRAACDQAERLLAKNAGASAARGPARRCLSLRAEYALAGGATEEARTLANRALQAARNQKTSDPVEDRYAVARALRLVGDTHARAGNRDVAKRAWSEALAVLPSGVAERPTEMSQRVEILERLGQGAQARPIIRRLRAIGYRRST
jgi:eukaryotic-like serine/threonine-protein kinase